MDDQNNPQNSVWNTSIPSRASNADLYNLSPPRTSTTASLPRDVASSRKNRINRDLLAYFQRPAPPRAATNAIPQPLKGIGVYTHIEVTPQQQVIFPHQRFTDLDSRIEFLPLGGPGRVERKVGLRAELPEEVSAVYEEVRALLAWEEKEGGKEDQVDPRVKFEGLGLPDIMVPSPPPMPVPPSPPYGTSPTQGSEDMDIDEVEEEEHQVWRDSTSDRQSSRDGGVRRGSSSGRRPSIPGDGSVGATRAEVERTATSAPIGAATSTNAGGTVYDASRDPRRRGK